jgi:FixJ family two-component response regulator
MMQQREYIAVVDDDESVRESLPDLIGVFGHKAVAFASANWRAKGGGSRLSSSQRTETNRCVIVCARAGQSNAS